MKSSKFAILILGLSTVILAYTPPSGAVSKLNSYRGYSELTNAAGSMNIDTYTYNLTTWQISHGGFFKATAAKYVNPWNGTDAKSEQVRNGVELGTIDNNATIQEMRLLAVRYKETQNSSYKTRFKEAFQKSLSFLLVSQHSLGGWPQMHPKRGNYSDQVTYNDNAVVRVMVLAKDIVDGVPPFDGDIIASADRQKLKVALEKAVDFALKSQIVNNGAPTVWCAQHDTANYKPVEGRAYELPSKSGSESAGIVWFLMNWENQTPEVQKAIKGALAWYKKTRVGDLKFSKGEFLPTTGASMWYRFYEVNNDNYFFCDREGVSSKTQNLANLSDDRRYGYQWAGDYGSALLNVEASYLSAIASLPPSSSSQASLSSSVTSSSSSQAPSSSKTSCGPVNCTAQIQGESFCAADGIFEDKNAGFSGTGYVNPSNEVGGRLLYAINASGAGTYTLYVRYANGTVANRSAYLQVDESNALKSIDFSTTGNWTTWNTITVAVDLPTGHSRFSLIALTEEGLPNIDWIGWNDTKLSITSCEQTNSLKNSLIQNTVSLRGSIQNGVLFLKNAPEGLLTIRVRQLNGEIVLEQQTSSASGVFLGILKNGVYLFEVIQNQQPAGSFLLPVYQK